MRGVGSHRGPGVRAAARPPVASGPGVEETGQLGTRVPQTAVGGRHVHGDLRGAWLPVARGVVPQLALLPAADPPGVMGELPGGVGRAAGPADLHHRL